MNGTYSAPPTDQPAELLLRMDPDTTRVVEHCDEFEASTEHLPVLVQRRDARVLGMLQSADRPWMTSSRPADSTWLLASPYRNSMCCPAGGRRNASHAVDGPIDGSAIR